MDRLTERLSDARKAIETFGRAAGLAAPTDIERDAAIQRFEYSFEAAWKAVQSYLELRERLTIGSPGSCIRASRDIGLLNDEEAKAALEMAKDRNLTVHTYKEKLAKEIYGRLAGYRTLLAAWIERTERRLSEQK